MASFKTFAKKISRRLSKIITPKSTKRILKSLGKIFKKTRVTLRLKKKKRIIYKKAVRRPAKRKISQRRPAKKLKKITQRSSSKRPAKIRVVKKSLAAKTKPEEPGILIGEVTHFFSKISVVVVKTTHNTIIVGDRIGIVGPQARFFQDVKSLQIESVDVQKAAKGKLVGLKTVQPARVGDKVYRMKSL